MSMLLGIHKGVQASCNENVEDVFSVILNPAGGLAPYISILGSKKDHVLIYI